MVGKRSSGSSDWLWLYSPRMDTPPLDLGPYPDQPGWDDAVHLDDNDPLASFRGRFVSGEADLIYLDGNSLGKPPEGALDAVNDVLVSEWSTELIRSWPARWWQLALEIGSQIAPLIGARANEVVVADSTSVALYKLALGALQAAPARSKIVTDDLNFPTDNYVLDAVAKQVGGGSVVTASSGGGLSGPVDAIIESLDQSTALLSLSHVTFKSGYLYDMAKLTRAAHQVGAKVLWDLSHSVGVVPIDLDAAAVDLAVGCTYKYLNGGPGSPAFIYASEKRASDIDNPIPGWWGHQEPFSFDPRYSPAAGIQRFQTGTMPILSLTPVACGVALTAEAGIERIRHKSQALSTFFIEQANMRLGPLGFEVASPSNADERGSHVSLRHRDAWRIVQAITKSGKIIPDFREPDNIRFGLAPLYTSFTDVHTAIGRVAALIGSRIHETYPNRRHTVT